MSSSSTRHTDIAIIGAGFSGLGMAIRLKQKGRNDFVIVEQAKDVGGCWRDNTYPGCCCDIPSHLYSLSFEQNPHWSRKYPPQKDIYHYLQGCAKKHDLLSHIRFDSEVSEIRYCDVSQRWLLALPAGNVLSARFILVGKGPLNVPKLPDMPGLESFTGKIFHSSQWDHEYDLKDKRVAVVGTGASAIQFIPQIAPQVKQLNVFQRSPGWMLPRPDREISRFEKWLFNKSPAILNLYRQILFWRHEFRVNVFKEQHWLHGLAKKMAKKYIRKQVQDSVLREKLTPTFSLGCKRLLISNDYYPTFNRSNVDLITSGVAAVEGSEVIASDGSRREVDAIIFGTGFEAADPIGPGFIIGPQGQDLYERWDEEGAQAYKGVSVAGLPNFFFLIGPNSGLGHNSMILMLEAQVEYILQCLDYMSEHNIAQWDVKRSVQDEYNQVLEGKVDHSIWASGCHSWYINKKGRNTTMWPGFVYEYQKQMVKLQADAYIPG